MKRFVLLCFFVTWFVLSTSGCGPSQTSEPTREIPTAPPTPIPTEKPTPPSPPADASLGDTWIHPSDGMVMVYVPAGEFLMGVDGADTVAGNDEKPQHTVYLDSFWIDQLEVTNAMYIQCVDTGGCDPPSNTLSHYGESYYGNSQYDNYPLISATWFDAKAYCEWAGRRLPTEAEWEKAARGMDGRTYPWGEGVSCDRAHYVDCGSQTALGGSYPDGASPYGAFDMAGNVWEWVSSLYQDYPYDDDDGREDLQADDSRVLRGGSWHYGARSIRTTHRLRSGPAFTHSSYGFRCASSPQVSSP